MSADRRRRLRDATVDERSDLLDAVAAEAAAGSAAAAEDLAWAVLELGLARPSIRRYLLRPVDVEAAEQRTLVAVALRIGSFRGASRFTTWLYQVAGNEAKQLIRAERRHTDRATDGEPDDHAEEFVARVSSMIADESAVQAAIAALPDRHRGPLVLREIDGLTYDEIAVRLDVPVGTAKTWVRRGREELASRLADLYRPTRPEPGER